MDAQYRRAKKIGQTNKALGKNGPSLVSGLFSKPLLFMNELTGFRD
jgi:hypothetical protein